MSNTPSKPRPQGEIRKRPTGKTLVGDALPGFIDGAAFRPRFRISCNFAEDRETEMASIDTGRLPVIEQLPGWHGRYFDSQNMTFAHYDFAAGATIHEHAHPEEEVYEVIEGELEITVDGVVERARPGLVIIVPPNIRHFVRAITNGKLIVIDHPKRQMA
jgi:quercetin dioxygenase-like cupin family protein